MRILVTGARGFIGSHIVDVLQKNKVDVVAVDDRSSGVDHASYGVPIGNGRCEEVGVKFFPQYPDAVIHFAGRADISKNWHATEPNRQQMWQNLNSTVSLLEWMAEGKPIPFVLASTAAVYGSRFAGMMLSEDVPSSFDSESPYAASKLAAEAALFAYAKRLGFKAYALRLAQVVGARYHHGHVADFVHRFDGGEDPLKVRDDGKQKKSAVHALDVAEAALALIQQEAPSGAYNVSSKELWSVRDTVRVMGCEAVYADKASAWVGDPKSVTLDTRKLDTYYLCNRSVEQGVREAITYLRANKFIGCVVSS